MLGNVDFIKPLVLRFLSYASDISNECVGFYFCLDGNKDGNWFHYFALSTYSAGL